MTNNSLENIDKFFSILILIGLCTLFIVLIYSMCSAMGDQYDKFESDCRKYGGVVHVQYRSPNICLKKDSVVHL